MTVLLERHRKAKETIAARLRELADIAEEVGMKTLATDVRETRLPKLEAERFHLVVLGEFNHGKTTFVNALLGGDVLPVGITPTTAAIGHVLHGPEPRAKVVLTDGEQKQLTPADLGDWVTVAGERTDEVRYVEVEYPADILRENIVLVDTPGVNDLNEQRAEITFGYVPRADAVIFLLDAGQALKDSEREFLSSHVLEGSRDRLVFVLGKMDLLTDAERGAVIDYVRRGLGKLVDEPVLFSVSAKRWLDGEREASGMEPLLEYLGRFLAADRARVLLDNAAADAIRTAGYLQQNLGVRMRAFELDVEELETRVASVREQLHASKRTLDELHGRIRADAAAIKSQVGLDLETFTRKFIEVLPEQIDAVDAVDVKRYLGPFIEEKFRDFAELEGAKIASFLEKLAEEVIAVTNENVAAASSALASRLGPADTRVDIDVDSFKYDVGVYAVGALGTTVFLFINTLAGGLLTLAAPILAILVRSKVAGDIREQAKERVPGVIQRASEAMRPHFDSCIDEFGERLSAFVTSAGNALYKGISEILDQTIEERKRGEAKVEALTHETSARVDKVRSARGELLALRESLWRDREPEPASAKPAEREPTETA